VLPTATRQQGCNVARKDAIDDGILFLCFGMATGKTCPHGDEDRIHISGTQQRAMLAEGAPVPREFGRPEVIDILREYYAGLE
jgi:ATP sulfurylase